MEGRLDEDAVGWFFGGFATDARRQSGPEPGILPSSLVFPGLSHREQRVLLLLLLLLLVAVARCLVVSDSRSGSGSGSDSSLAGMKDAGGEVELDKRSKPGHGRHVVAGKELCKSYPPGRPSGWRVARVEPETAAPPPLEAGGGVLTLAFTAMQVPVPVQRSPYLSQHTRTRGALKPHPVRCGRPWTAQLTGHCRRAISSRSGRQSAPASAPYGRR